LKIPIVAICDTNADPELIDFPIAANDDSIKSIRTITRELSEAMQRARHGASVAEMAAAPEETERRTIPGISSASYGNIEDDATDKPREAF
jgi:small subunit ribosomal protein S2